MQTDESSSGRLVQVSMDTVLYITLRAGTLRKKPFLTYYRLRQVLLFNPKLSEFCPALTRVLLSLHMEVVMIDGLQPRFVDVYCLEKLSHLSF